ncbi:hypothetical protein [Ruegeria faecimaris]|uniref:hypothetical protein n=1 Tax=Ruegeria faecimaris TaxID=686389 RepID=UPI00232D6F5F|nr:hypothetical protein [Ruegeria faecimaris]
MNEMTNLQAVTSISPPASRYDNLIGGDFCKPKAGRYFDNLSPIPVQPIGQIARSDASDVEAALDPAHSTADT